MTTPNFDRLDLADLREQSPALRQLEQLAYESELRYGGDCLTNVALVAAAIELYGRDFSALPADVLDGLRLHGAIEHECTCVCVCNAPGGYCDCPAVCRACEGNAR